MMMMMMTMRRMRMRRLQKKQKKREKAKQSASKSSKKESDKVMEYRRMVFGCGLRPKYKEIFTEELSDARKIAKLKALIKDFFRSINFRGIITMNNCERARARSDALREAAELDTSLIISSSGGRRPQRAASVAARRNVQRSLH